jgi:hypothetical protein
VKIKGYQTYITLAVAGLYWVAVHHGWIQRVPEIDAALVILVVGFLRAGSKRDAARAVQQIKDDAPSAS